MSSSLPGNVKQETSGVVHESSPVIDPLHTLQTVQVTQAVPTVQSVKQESISEVAARNESPTELPAQVDLSLVSVLAGCDVDQFARLAVIHQSVVERRDTAVDCRKPLGIW